MNQLFVINVYLGGTLSNQLFSLAKPTTDSTTGLLEIQAVDKHGNGPPVLTLIGGASLIVQLLPVSSIS